MPYGFQYQDAGTRCSGGPMVGTIALEKTIIEFLGTGSFGIYNCRPKRTGKSLSLHAVGRAWDCVPKNTTQGNALAFFYVAAAQVLGIQRVIWGFGPGRLPGEWDSRPGEREFESYSGPAHDDHIHVELCVAAGQTLTRAIVIEALREFWKGPLLKPLPGDEEDDMAQVPQEEWDELVKMVKRLDERVEDVEIRTRENYVRPDGKRPRTVGNDVHDIKDLLNKADGG